MSIKGYFACPLASGSNQEREKVRAMVGLIEKMGYKILDRHVVFPYEGDEITAEFCRNSGIKKDDVSPQVVRRQDLDWVLESQFMVLDCTVGSWGGGIEFDHATVVRKLLGLKLDCTPFPNNFLLVKGDFCLLRN